MQNHFLLLYFHRSASVPEETGEERQQVAKSRESMLSLVTVRACCVGKIPVCQEPAKASRGQSIPNGCETLEANKNMKGKIPCIFLAHSGRISQMSLNIFCFKIIFSACCKTAVNSGGCKIYLGFLGICKAGVECGVINTVDAFPLMNFKMLGFVLCSRKIQC